MSDAMEVAAVPISTSKRRRLLNTALLVLGLLGLVVATTSAVRESRGVSLPSPAALVISFALTRAAMMCTARAWVRLVGPSADALLVTGAFYESQLVKYLPAGGLLQAAGQVGMTAAPGMSVKRVSLAFVTLTLATVAAGLTLGAGLVLTGSAPEWSRILAPLGLAAPLLLHQRVLRSSLDLARRGSRRFPEPDLLPEQGALWTAFGWCLANHALYAAGFTVLLRSMSPEIPVVAATLGYVVSWVAGFLVLPLPSGIGVREVVLLALIPNVTSGPLLAASLAQRLVAIAAEVLAAVGSRLGRLRRRRAQLRHPH